MVEGSSAFIFERGFDYPSGKIKQKDCWSNNAWAKITIAKVLVW